MVLTKEASQHKPKKPLTPYFKFRLEKLHEITGEQNKNKATQQLWYMLDQKQKQQFHENYEHELEKYRKLFEEWKDKFHVTEKDLRQKSAKKRVYDSQEEEQKAKPIKTKGSSKKERDRLKMEKARRAKQEKSRRKNQEKETSQEEYQSQNESSWSQSSQGKIMSPQREKGKDQQKTRRKSLGKGRSSSKIRRNVRV